MIFQVGVGGSTTNSGPPWEELIADIPGYTGDTRPGKRTNIANWKDPPIFTG
jgi:hypothetical protein